MFRNFLAWYTLTSMEDQPQNQTQPLSNQEQPVLNQSESSPVPPHQPASTQPQAEQPLAPAIHATAQQQNQPASVQPIENTRSKQLKRFFLQLLLGSLICAAVVAVVAVLAGSFNSTFARALGTIAMVALHALLSFGYISENDKRDKASQQTNELFSNTVFAIIVISFFTSIFAIWQVISLDLTLKLYLFYGVILFATLHGEVLYRLRGFEKRIDSAVIANYVLMSVVIVMLTIVIFYPERSDLGSFYYRLLAAVGIVDATATITAIIMHKMYMQKHPELAKEVDANEKAKSKNFWKNPFVVILIIFLAFQFIGGIIGLIVGGV